MVRPITERRLKAGSHTGHERFRCGPAHAIDRHFDRRPEAAFDEAAESGDHVEAGPADIGGLRLGQATRATGTAYCMGARRVAAAINDPTVQCHLPRRP